MMRANLAQGVNLQTYTEVRVVMPSARSPGRWIVQTARRGEIECAQVVHATNAYSSALEPLLRPQPHMCNLVVPPAPFRGARGLPGSYGILAGRGTRK
jgi:glycine/D-amino acid oxidase-like deaminating enzyme